MKVIIAVDVDGKVLDSMSRASEGVMVSQFVPWNVQIEWASRDPKTGRITPNGYRSYSQFTDVSLLDDTMAERIAQRVIDALKKAGT